MTAAVTLPADLGADIDARPAAYWPDVDAGAEVLNLDDGDICRVLGIGRIRGDLGPLHVERAGIASSYLQAWALVGSVDVGPRPNVGQRVLVLDPPPGFGHPIGVVTRVDDDRRLFLYHPDGVSAGITRWALLPDPAGLCDGCETVTAVQASDDGRGQFCTTCLPIANVGCSCSPMERCARCLALLPPGALPARQLDTGPRVVKLDQDATVDDVRELDATRAERDRYRAALQRIAANNDDEAAAIAREALAEPCTDCGHPLDQDPPTGTPCAEHQ